MTDTDFNPRSRMGSDRLVRGRIRCRSLFQSTLPHGERQTVTVIPVIFGEFQSTLPHGERRRRRPRSVPTGRDFNPRSRMGSDLRRRMRRPNGGTYFNPRSRMGSDWRAAIRDDTHARISIHAPAWGATNGGASVTCSVTLFQSTLPHGERHAAWNRATGTTRFQSTLPHGERLGPASSFTRVEHFNPRSRMGSDCNNGQHIPLCGRYHPLLRTMCCCGSVLSAV